MLKKILGPFLLLISIAVTLFCVEIALKVFYPQIVVCKVNYDWQMKDDLLPYVPKPNYRGRMQRNNQFDVALTTNSSGFRSLKEYALKKPENTTRVVFMGDSFTFGWGVDDKDIFTRLLEDRFNTEGDGRKFEVINAGVYGYDIGEHRKMFDRILKYDPDYIFLGFCMENDYNITVPNNVAQPERLTTERSSILRFFRGKINNLHMVALVRDRLYVTFPKIRNVMLSLGINNKRDIFLKKYPPELDKLMENVGNNLIEMNTIAREHGARFNIFLIPLKEQIYCRDAINKFSEYDIEKPNQILKKIAADDNIECLDLLPDLLKESAVARQRLYFDTDPHWTKYGHRAVAEALFNRYNKMLYGK